MTANDGSEHEDPMHIRPYVRLPDGGEGGSAGGEVPGADASFGHGSDTSGASAASDAPSPPHSPPSSPFLAPGPFGPEAETTALPDLSPFARQGTAETAELPVVSAQSGNSRSSRSSRSSRAAADGSRGAHSHRRGKSGGRRPATGVLAAAGVAAALGAGLLTTQLLTGDRGGEDSHSTEDRALDQGPTGAPTHGLPSASEPESKAKSPSPGASSEPEEEPSALPSRSSASGSPRADRDDDGHTQRGVGSSPSASARQRTPESGPPSREREERGPERPQRPERPGGPTLDVGDSGPAVADLQRRLKQVGYLSEDAEEDGVYSSTVQEGVFRYQTTYGIDEDDPGAYGPYTRKSLESRT